MSGFVFVPEWQVARICFPRKQSEEHEFHYFSSFCPSLNLALWSSPLPQHFGQRIHVHHINNNNNNINNIDKMAVNNVNGIAKPPARKKLLPDLPDELLIQILNSLSSQQDLHALCLVNRRLHHIADPVLYKSIAFEEPKHHIAFSESLNKRPRRGSLIQNIRLEYPGSELDEIISLRDGSYKIDNFSDTISRMSNLENLEISVPESLLHGIGTLFNGPFDLACLKTCESDASVDW
jgi:hypothetical protein